jgi:DNA repair exonuclease SbcCD ATPase subunit
LGRGNRQRTAARLDPRPAQASADELDLAVQKLSEGLEAIERQGRTGRPRAPSIRPETLDAPLTDPSDAGDRDFVTYSLDRLEARLEALSRRLQQRAAGGTGMASTAPSSTARRLDPASAAADEDDRTAQLAEARRLAEAEEVRRAATDAAEKARQAEAAAEARFEAEQARSEAEQARREAEQARREAAALAEDERRREIEAAAEIADAKREAEAAEARRRSDVAELRRQAELVDAKRQAEVTEARRQAELAEARRQADVQEARRQAEAAEARRRAEAEAAAEDRRRLEEEAEAVRLADLEKARRDAAALEQRHRSEAEEARRQAEIMVARREAELAARIDRQFAEIERRIDGLQSGLDENQIEPVRGELLELVQQISDLSRGGRATTGALDEIGSRLDLMDVKLNAARNMAGNRLGDIQDKLSGLVDRLDEIEVEIPGFDAIRVNQGAILERFDRMEGLVTHIASPEELFERVDALKRQMQTVASQREVARIEEQILRLTERLDALPDDLSDKVVLGRIEEQLGGLATEFMEARRQRKSVANELEDHLSELSAQLRAVGETGRTPDLSGIEERVSSLASQIADDRIAANETLARLEGQLGALGDAIQGQEDNATKAIARLEQRVGTLADAIENQDEGEELALLESLTGKIDELAHAIDAQDSPGARRDIEGLARSLDQLSAHISEQTEHLSRQQLAPLAQQLVAIEERITTLSNRAPDPRALQTQIEGIVSRLELLKGRSIDPARMNDLFDRVDAAIRAIPEDRFERLEQRLDDVIAPAERFDRLEKKIAEAANAATGERFTTLERKLDDISRIFTAGSELLTQEDLTELRSDIVALRRELRSGLGQGDTNLGELLRTIAKRLDGLPREAPVTAADLEAQVERIARILDDPSQGRSGLVHIETSLKAIEQRLEETRRSLDRSNLEGEEAAAAGARMESVAGLARALSDDVTVLKGSTEATEKKTRDAIDAVQDTLEAVVKRMAFLERDSDATSAAPRERGRVAARMAASPEVSEPERETRDPEVVEAPETAAPDEPRVSRTFPNQTAGGFLGRLTSRQL